MYCSRGHSLPTWCGTKAAPALLQGQLWPEAPLPQGGVIHLGGSRQCQAVAQATSIWLSWPPPWSLPPSTTMAPARATLAACSRSIDRGAADFHLFCGSSRAQQEAWRQNITCSSLLLLRFLHTLPSTNSARPEMSPKKRARAGGRSLRRKRTCLVGSGGT